MEALIGELWQLTLKPGIFSPLKIMQLGALQPLKETDLDVTSIAKNSAETNKHLEGTHSELTQIKWLLVALALIILLKQK